MAQTLARSDPESPCLILGKTQDRVPNQAIRGGELGECPTLQSNQTAPTRANPESASAVGQEGVDGVVLDGGSVRAIEECKTISIEAG
jgi:hypothetical protein